MAESFSKMEAVTTLSMLMPKQVSTDQKQIQKTKNL